MSQGDSTAENDKSTSLAKHLTELSNLMGLRQDDLSARLAGGLCRLWNIRLEDSPGVVFDKASRGLGKYIDRLPATPTYSANAVRVTARVAFNIFEGEDSYDGKLVRNLNLDKRRNWLAEVGSEDHKTGSGQNQTVGLSTQRGWMPKSIAPFLAGQILQDWRRQVPEETFPFEPLRQVAPAQPLNQTQPEQSPAVSRPSINRPSWPPKQKIWVCRHPWWTVFAALVLIFGLVLWLVPGVRLWESHTTPPQAAPKSPHPSATRTPPTSTSPASVQYQLGDALSIAYDDMNSEGGGSSVAFATSQADEAATYVNEYNNASSSQEAGTFGTIMAAAMANGAYSYGQLVLSLQFTTRTSQPVQIFNIRALVQSSAQVATGAVIDEPGGSGQSFRIAFDLDDRTPFAKAETNGNIGGLYFGPATGTIDVTPNDPSPKFYYLDFHAEALAHTFEVAVDYNMGGKRYTQLLSDQAGHPLVYRVTGRLCDSPSILDSAGQQQFRQLSYGTVYYQQVDGNGNYTLQPSDPAAFVSQDHCN